jgi:hypothetical protein
LNYGIKQSIKSKQSMNSSSTEKKAGSKKFLGIHFLGCNTYARLYPNREGTHFQGRCPRCGLTMKVRIAPYGSDDRFFHMPCLMTRIGAAQPRG